MAVVLDATVSTKTSNSYCDVAYADEYFAQHYDTAKATAWAALATNQKELLLVHATRIIDTARFTLFLNWQNYGLRYDYSTGMVLNLSTELDPVKYWYFQKLQFPRNLDIDPDTGAVYIPEPIKMAQCEQAYYLLNFDDTAMANRIMGITNDTIGIGRGQIHLNQQYASDGSAIAPLALEYIRPFLLKSGTRMRRG
jgi:hypothetical protein